MCPFCSRASPHTGRQHPGARPDSSRHPSPTPQIHSHTSPPLPYLSHPNPNISKQQQLVLLCDNLMRKSPRMSSMHLPCGAHTF